MYQSVCKFSEFGWDILSGNSVLHPLERSGAIERLEQLELWNAWNRLFSKYGCNAWELVTAAVALLEQFPLRSPDALHVACASEWSIDLFVCADE